MSKDNLKHVETMIGSDVVITGDVLLNGGAIIGGKIIGNVVSKCPVRLTKTAQVRGNITSKEIYLGGEVEGNVFTSGRIVLRSTARVTGNLVYRQLVIEEGAQFTGKCEFLPEGYQEHLSDNVSERIPLGEEIFESLQQDVSPKMSDRSASENPEVGKWTSD